MDQIIAKNYSKATKVIGACHPRSNADSTIVNGLDRLQLVYDVFTPTSEASGDKIGLNLIFLHGSGMNRSVWEYYVAHLNDHNLGSGYIKKIVLLDQVTHGDSAVLNSGKLGVSFDWSDGARDACLVAQKEFTEETEAINVVVGHSMGGFQAMCCPILMPYLFDYVLTIEPVAHSANLPNPQNYTVMPKTFFQAINMRIKDTFKNQNDYDYFMDNKSFFIKTHPEIMERFKETEKILLKDGSIRKKTSRPQELLCYLTLHPTAYWFLNSAKHIKIPVVSIVGGKATWAPKENQILLQKLIPNYTKDIIPEGEHLMNIEMPDENIKRMAGHLTDFVVNYKKNPNRHNYKELSTAERENQFDKLMDQYLKDHVSNGKPEFAKF